MPNVQHSPDLSPTAIRHSVLANGYKPIPVNGKRPQIKGWQQLSPTTVSIDAWERGHPDHANTGILTGDVVAIDVDAANPDASERLIAALMKIPGAMQSPCRTGRAPKCLFIFRATEPRKKATTPVYIVNGEKCQIEVLGEGQQFVAFGIHPDTDKPYTWASGDPMTVPFHDLPEITPAQIDEYLSAAEAILAEIGEPERKAAPVSARASSGSTFWTRVNAAALDNTDAWVQLLFSTAHKEPGTGAWRITSRELGRGLQEDISIHADGIQDFGEERGLTAIDLVREYGGASSPTEAAFWLCEQLGRSPADLGWDAPSIKPVKMSFNKRPAILEAANDDTEDFQAPTVYEEARGGMPESLCYPPGFVGDLSRFIVSCSRFPSPHLALASSIAFTSALIGRRYKGPTGFRSNIYVVGLAESGVGKQITIDIPKAIAGSTAAGDSLVEKIVQEEPSSVQGLAESLRKYPAAVMILDEFGNQMQDWFGTKAAAYKAEIASALLQLTGAAQGSTWGGRNKAAGRVPSVHSPCLSLYGVSTQSTFWGALNSGKLSDGLLARLLIIDAGTAVPKKVRRPENDKESIPEWIVSRVEDLLGKSSTLGAVFASTLATGETKPGLVVGAQWASGVDDIWENFDQRIRDEAPRIAPEYRPLINRVSEHAAKLALIVAVGCNHRDVVITREIQEWANAVAEYSFRFVLAGADENISDNDRSKEYLRIRGMISRAGKNGLTRSELVKRLKGNMTTLRIEEILGQLSTAREAFLAKRSSHKGQTITRLWSAKDMPDDAELVTA